MSNEKSGDDRKGTIAVSLMLQGGGAGVHDVRDLWSSCLFYAGLAVNEANLGRVPDRRRHSFKSKREGVDD